MEQKGQPAVDRKPVIWLYGFSGSGKTTIAEYLQKDNDIFLLDGDILRDGLCKDLGFSIADRMENIRRAAEITKLISQVKPVVACFITPTEEMRSMVKAICSAKMIWIKTPLSVCEQRDPKGLYERVRSGHLHHFTGIDSVFESPKNPDVVIETDGYTIAESAQSIISLLS